MKKSLNSISVVIPLCNEEEVIDELVRRLKDMRNKYQLPFKVIFVDDGSIDGTLHKLKDYSKEDPLIKILSLSRNFGHQVAITAGIDNTDGDAVVIMDGDLQDPPEFIPELVRKLEEGYDIVYAIRSDRGKENFLRKSAIRIFYRILQKISSVPIPPDAGDFRIISKRVADVLKDMREEYRYVRGLIAWTGFKQTGIEYRREQRFKGTSKYPFRKLLRLAWDGLTSFTFVPLRLASFVGTFISCASFCLGLILILVKIFKGISPQGWTSLCVIIFFLSGIILMVLGIIGEYIGRIYAEVKKRPLYLIKEKI